MAFDLIHPSSATSMHARGDHWQGQALCSAGAEEPRLRRDPILREVIAPASSATPRPRSPTSTSPASATPCGRQQVQVRRARAWPADPAVLQGRRHPGAEQDSLRQGEAVDRYDLNTIVFGDSANSGNRVLPVKAAAHSDAVSLQPYAEIVDATFHNRASEDGTLFDASGRRTRTTSSTARFCGRARSCSDDLLQWPHGAGRALDHLLLSIGMAGAYGARPRLRHQCAQPHRRPLCRPLRARRGEPYVAVEAVRGRIDGWSGGCRGSSRPALLQCLCHPVDAEAVAEHQVKLRAGRG